MADIMIVGEINSGKDTNGPFSDGLGKMCKAWLRQVGIDPRQCSYTNVFPFAPKGRSSVYALTGPKVDGIPDMKFWKPKHYIRAEYKPHLDQLWKRVNHEQPNLIIAMGDTALWALTSEKSIKAARGRVTEGNAAINGRKVLPTYHPKTVVADWTLRPIVLADLDKAKRQSVYPEVRRPRHLIHIEPSLADIEDFITEYILPATFLSVDIESKDTMITCVGFAPNTGHALVIPFYDELADSGNYWPTVREELLAWAAVRKILKLGKQVIGQNYQYDMQYLWRFNGIPNPDAAHDTMLLHHALQPEMLKGLGFLASIYTDEMQWKGMHHYSGADKSVKKED